MSALVIANITIPISEGKKNPPFRVGTSVRVFTGGLRSTVRIEKRSWSVTTIEILDSVATSIESAIVNAAHVVASGDLIGGNVTVEVVMAGKQMITAMGSDGLGYMWIMQLNLQEV